jgi:PAS domain S-box-containing protein
MIVRREHIKKDGFTCIGFFCFVILFLVSQGVFAQNIKIERGLIDLSQEDFNNGKVINLAGEWEFFHKKQYTEISQSISQKHIVVPFDWNHFGYEGTSYAVYRLKMLMPKKYDDLLLKVGTQSTAYNLYINGNLTCSVGQFGTNKQESVPAYEVVNQVLPNHRDTIEIVFEISNFHYRKGGLWSKIHIGKKGVIEKQNRQVLVFDTFLVGALFTLLIYHLILFFQLKKNKLEQDKILLLFSCVTLLALLRTSATGQLLLTTLFPAISWTWLVRFEFIPFFMLVAVAGRYIYTIFPDEFSKRASDFALIICIIPSVMALFIPIYYSSFFITPIEIITLILLLYFVYGVGKAVILKRETAKLAFFALIVMVISAVNDILNAQNILNTFYITPFGIFSFFIIQAVSLSKLLTSSFKKVNVLSANLVKSNEELEQKVTERTKEIQAINEHLKLLSTVASKTDNSVLIIDAQGEIEWINEGFTKMHGYTLEELRNISTNFFNIPTVDTNAINSLNTAVQFKKSTNYIIHLKNKFAKKIWVHTTWTPVFDNQENLIKLIAIDTNITKIIEEQEKVKEQNELINKQKSELINKHYQLANSFENLQQLNQIFHTITENHDVTSIISAVYKNINQLMDGTGFGIGIYNEKENKIGFSNYIEKSTILPYYEVTITDSNSLAVWCFLNEEDVLITDYQNEKTKYTPQLSIPKLGEVPLSLIYVPLISNKRKIGVITVQSFKKNAYTPYHLDLLKNIAIYTSIALENAEAFKEIETLSLVASKTFNYVAIIGKDDKIEWVNESFTKLTGFSFEEAVGKMPSEIIAGKETELKVVNEIDEAIFKKKESYEGIVTNYKKDGTPFRSAIDLSPILDQKGDLLKYFVIGRDISEREKSQKELKIQRDIAVAQKNEIVKAVKQLEENERIIREKNIELNRLSHVVSTTDNAVMIISPNGEIEWVNKGFTKMYGFAFEEFTQKSSNIFEAVTSQEVILPIQKAIKTEQSISYDAELRTKEGKKIWVHTTWTPIFDENHTLKKLIAIDADVSKQKEIEETLRLNNIEISKQHKHITDSILYAQKIQHALLAPVELIEDMVKQLKNVNNFDTDYFILYKPKDIVSGDFYWAKYYSDSLYFAAADCTGHGVPGAFMSALGISFLNDIVNKRENLEPNIILDKLKHKLISTLRQSDYNLQSRDGMDISLCRINLTNMELEYAGAYQPLYLIRSVEGKPTLIKYTGDRMPIGVHKKNSKDFTKTTIKIENKDTFYFGSDGYISQFGGEKNQTFKSRRLEKFLLKISDLPMDKQKESLTNVLANWQQDREQVDDILLIGVRITLEK